MNKLLSVITPVYNAEKTIHRTIDSVLNQTYINFELILVNDGSKDNSLEICKEYALWDSRIKVYNQINKGPSAARNLALDNAKGYYILFIDADDWIVPEAYEKMVSVANDTGSDVVECGFQEEINGEIYSSNEYNTRDDLLKGDHCIQYALDMVFSPVSKRLKPYTCIRLIKRDLIEDNNLRFNEDIRRSEDYLFISKLLMKAKKIKFVKNEILYTYVHNASSITNNYMPDYWDMVLSIYKDLSLDAKRTDIKEYMVRVDKMLVQRAIVALTNESFSNDGIKNKFSRIRLIIKNEKLREIVKGIGTKDGINYFGKKFIILKYKLGILLL